MHRLVRAMVRHFVVFIGPGAVRSEFFKNFSVLVRYEIFNFFIRSWCGAVQIFETFVVLVRSENCEGKITKMNCVSCEIAIFSQWQLRNFSQSILQPCSRRRTSLWKNHDTLSSTILNPNQVCYICSSRMRVLGDKGPVFILYVGEIV